MNITKGLPLLWHKEIHPFLYILSFSSAQCYAFFDLRFVLRGLLESVKSIFGGSSSRTLPFRRSF
jgi:hypothetical protein